jgi:predicted  nucleic acid-binding Zn-ribbon protein
MNFNPLAQFGGFDSDEDDSAPQPLFIAPTPVQTTAAIPLMQANGRMARQGDDDDDDESELSETEDVLTEPPQFTVKHMKQQRQSVLAYNAGGPHAVGIGIDPKLQNEIVALNQKIQSLQVLLDKSRNKARSQAVDLEDAEDRVAQLETETQELNDKMRQRDHVISNLEYELQRAQKKDSGDTVSIEKAGFADKLKLFQSKIAMSAMDSSGRKPTPGGGGGPPQARSPQNVALSSQRSGSMTDTFQPRSTGPSDLGSSSGDVEAVSPPPLPQVQTVTVVDDTKVKELEAQIQSLQAALARKDEQIEELQNGTGGVTQAEFVALGEEMASYQHQVGTLQAQCGEVEEMLRNAQEAILAERSISKDQKEEYMAEEARLLAMIDELHSSIQQTSVDVREYKDQIQLLQSQNYALQQQVAQNSKPRPTISLPPTPSAKPTVLPPTAEVEEITLSSPATVPPIPPADDSDDDEEAPPPPTTPRKSTVATSMFKAGPPSNPPSNPVTPRVSSVHEDQVLVAVPEQSTPASKPAPVDAPGPQQLKPIIEPMQVVQVDSPATLPKSQTSTEYEETVDDGELITKGLLTKLGLDSTNKPSSKRHFFALFSTKTRYSEYYGQHIQVACELRWGRQESDYTSYPYGATVTNSYVGAQAIQYLKHQGTNGQTLAAMVRPEDIPRLLVLTTVDGRYVLLMCRDSEKGNATGPERALAWGESVKIAIKKNATHLGRNADEIFAQYEDELDDETSSTPSFSSQTGSISLPPLNLQQPPPRPSQTQPPPLPAQLQTHRESIITPLQKLQQPLQPSQPSQPPQPPQTPTISREASSSSFAPSPAHFMTRPLVSPTITQTAAPSSAPIPPMRGTLTKFIHSGKSWHTKHFFLTSTSGVIQWGDSASKYKYHEFVKSVLRGQDKDLRIDPKAMKKANMAYNPDLMFSVQTTGKTLYLMAPTEESLNEWIDALERALFNQTHPR